jgi:NAD(P)H-hydrate repair Nnr-like enzyme with NAD(P)H-hydrate dehydratase domain
MTARDQAAATDRLRRALLVFRGAQSLGLEAHRRLKGQPQERVDAFWAGPGRRAEANMRAAAAEVVAAFKEFSAAGLVADAADRHAVTQAQRHLKESST